MSVWAVLSVWSVHLSNLCTSIMARLKDLDHAAEASEDLSYEVAQALEETLERIREQRAQQLIRQLIRGTSQVSPN